MKYKSLKSFLRLTLSSSQQVESELEEHYINKEVKNRVKALQKNKSFLTLVEGCKARAYEMAFAMSEYIPNQELRVDVKTTINDKLKDIKDNNTPIFTKKYSR